MFYRTFCRHDYALDPTHPIEWLQVPGLADIWNVTHVT